ncbi:hypothetical protein GWK47_009794 [Chionoecetes opilio]|uniref:Chitin-binding type-2 domain-containing protein n=1 Tax=Chionoecetes opilio TaxID=41210 RepID=A0A8J5CPF9_CHIOP|nr:hypothetical protein GWK47_009794 [Chionoecetes opilio]
MQNTNVADQGQPDKTSNEEADALAKQATMNEAVTVVIPRTLRQLRGTVRRRAEAQRRRVHEQEAGCGSTSARWYTDVAAGCLLPPQRPLSRLCEVVFTATGLLALDPCKPNCYALTPGLKVPDPKDCTHFYVCVKGIPSDHAVACPTDTMFDPLTRACVPGNNCEASCRIPLQETANAINPAAKAKTTPPTTTTTFGCNTMP